MKSKIVPAHAANFHSTHRSMAIAIAVGISVFVATPTLAHHAFGNALPTNGFEGFLSGLAHPIIGLDHFAFVVAVGLLAATKRQGIWLPIAFVLAALMGTLLHLRSLNLPAPELMVSASVLIFGVLLTIQNRPNLGILLGLGTIAGVFHGYAYAESIIGATMTPLIAYLLGFTLIQIAIAIVALSMSQRVLKQANNLGLRYIGFILCGVGIAFLSAVISG